MTTKGPRKEPLKLAIASGKGGTGKTTVAVNLFHFISKSYSLKTELIDCDVEEPNDLLFLHDVELDSEDIATQLIPVIENDKCRMRIKINGIITSNFYISEESFSIFISNYPRIV